MAYNQQNAFWDWVRSMDQGNGARNNGEGVDRPAQPIPGSWPYAYGNSFSSHWPYPPPPPPPEHEGPPPPRGPGHHGPGHHGPGPHGHHPPPPPPPEFGAGFPFGGGPFGHGGPHHRGGLFGGPRGGCHGRGGRRGRHGRRESRHRGERGDPDNEEGGEQQGPWGAFDLSGLLASLASHPLAQPYRHFFEGLAAQAQDHQQSGETARDGADGEEENSFTPPIDIFTTTTEYVLHVALPGAKKEDVGINWDSEKGVLNVAGVIYRQGDEEFLKQLSQGERKVGVFERAVKLPPRGQDTEEKEEVDSDGITAKLEDGVLVVRVPKVEREWTDVKKVDIQ